MHAAAGFDHNGRRQKRLPDLLRAASKIVASVSIAASTSIIVVLALERRLTALLHFLATMILEGFGGLRLRGALLVVALVRYRRGRHPINPG
jgi:hypothetical protein